MTDATPAISARNITKQFGDFVAVDGVSLDLKAGERRALIGPNGAGKTTLFNLISGRLQPSAGEVHYFGTSIAGLSPDKICRLGLVRIAYEGQSTLDFYVGGDGILVVSATFPFDTSGGGQA